MKPRTAALATENASEPAGSDERFAGFGVMGLPFSSGHLLALRRFPLSTVGPAYNSVWIRDPTGRWTIAATAPPQQSCARYFGAAVEEQLEADIHLEWADDDALRVTVPDPVHLEWTIVLRSTPLTRVMSVACNALPDGIWRARPFSQAMGAVAAAGLRTGTMQLTGRTPNRQHFVARPRRIWLVDDSTAVLKGVDLGPPASLPAQAHLADFWLPQRGLVMVGWSAFSPEPRA